MITQFEKCFIDTNVLIYASYEVFDFHKTAIEALKSMYDFYVNRQVFLEFYNVSTSNKVLSETSVPTVIRVMKNYSLKYKCLEENQYNVEELLSKIELYKIKGKDVFDIKIYLDMKYNNITKILTANEDDFKIFPEIEIINPFKKDDTTK